MKTMKAVLLMVVGLMISSAAFAANPTFRVCDKQTSTIDRMTVLDCVVDKNQPWTMEVELPDLEDGGTKLVQVHSAYFVKCGDSKRCAVVFSDTIKKGAVMGDSPKGFYRLDYGYYMGVDVNGNATEYLINTGPHFGGEVAGAGTGSPSTVSGAIFEASCAPQMDDDCTVNKKKVAKADLGKYLPVVKESDVQAAGGFCEYPICYNVKNNPIGISN